MKILCIHQNFPGQYKHLAPALAARGDEVMALTPKVDKVGVWNGVRLIPYKVQGQSTKGIHPWLQDFETKLIRGTSCLRAALQLKKQGYEPDVILAHHGWGESLFLKDVWPDAKLGLYCELYHQTDETFTRFDPEFFPKQPVADTQRIRMKNLNNRLHEEVMDAGISPTRFQAETFPGHWQDRLTVSHDGIDTDQVIPDPQARLEVSDGRILSRDDEVITFINRNLEPYRGYHIFMRSLPALLAARPKAQVVLLGGDEVSYGAKAPDGKTWKQIYIDEVRPQISDADWARVHFLGRVPYPRFLSMLQVSRVHVYLTYPFVLSWSLLEAMSAECAIVASSTAPVKEVIKDGETGLLIDFFDTEALTKTVVDLLENGTQRRNLGAAARAFVQENYDLKQICLPRQLAWVDALAETAGRRPQD